MRRLALGVVLLTLAVLAGCQAPATERPTTTAEPGLDLRFDPPYDAAAVLERVERLRGLNATGPIVVREYPRRPPATRDIPDRALGIRPPGALALGVASNASVRSSQPLGYTVRRDGVVQVYLMSRAGLDRFDTSQELVLAHELTHALQFQHGLLAARVPALAERLGEVTTDTRLTYRSVVEGDAMLVTETYRERYAPDASYAEYPRPVPDRGRWQAAVSTAPYTVGPTYLRTVGLDPASRTAALREPPASSRGLLHPEAPTRNVSVPAGPAEAGAFGRYRSDTVGELALRQTLTVAGLDRETAATAARGWLDGRMDYYRRSDGDRAVRWTTRWADPAEARAFLAAYRRVVAGPNATTTDGVTVVPATATTPRTALVVDRDGSTVTVLAARDPAVVRALRDALPARSQGSVDRTAGRAAQSAACPPSTGSVWPVM